MSTFSNDPLDQPLSDCSTWRSGPLTGMGPVSANIAGLRERKVELPPHCRVGARSMLLSVVARYISMMMFRLRVGTRTLLLTDMNCKQAYRNDASMNNILTSSIDKDSERQATSPNG